MAPPAESNPRVFMDFTAGQREVGRVEFELFADVVPRTAENFRALCTGERGKGRSGSKLHFRDSCLHRIIDGFMAQGGDFTKGDGTGGESIYGEKFEDENFDLQHDRPGLLSMANAGPDTNGSQFFITFTATPHLNGKHVVFGRVVEGMGVVQLLEKVSTGGNDKPRQDVMISDCGQVGEEVPLSQIGREAGKAGIKNWTDAGGKEGGGKGGKAKSKRQLEEERRKQQQQEEEEAVRREQEEAKEQEEQEAIDTSGMSDRERRMFQIKMKMNASRKANKKEVKDEFHRLSDPAYEKKQKAIERDSAKKAWEAEMKERGLTQEEAFMLETAEKAGAVGERERRKEKSQQSFGWDVFNQDSLYRAYQKRLDVLPKAGRPGARGALASASDATTYGGTSDVSKEGLDRLAADMEKQAEARAKFAKRKSVQEDADVDGINARNDHYNKKLRRFYDKYTVEIKQNLERGTAL